MKGFFLIILIFPILVQAFNLHLMDHCGEPVKHRVSSVRLLCSLDNKSFLSPSPSLYVNGENDNEEDSGDDGDDDSDGFDRLWDVSSLG